MSAHAIWACQAGPPCRAAAGSCLGARAALVELRFSRRHHRLPPQRQPRAFGGTFAGWPLQPGNLRVLRGAALASGGCRRGFAAMEDGVHKLSSALRARLDEKLARYQHLMEAASTEQEGSRREQIMEMGKLQPVAAMLQVRKRACPQTVLPAADAAATGDQGPSGFPVQLLGSHGG